jgi:EPS-associated MarR family transcriptional regulator
MREDARLRALRLIEANPKITQRQMANELGISLGATHYMLRALADRGLVKVGRFRASSNKQAYVYALTPHGLAEKSAIAARFLTRKRKEYEALRVEIDALGKELTGEASCGSWASGGCK